MRDYKKIDEILSRYWQCETSVEEERILQDFFLYEKNIPPHLREYQSLFEYRKAKQMEKLPDDFDKKILNRINALPKRKKIYPLRIIKVAASIALLIGLGFTAHLHQARVEQAQARETVLDALFMISDNLQKGEELIMRGLMEFSSSPSPLNPPKGDLER
jgi:hypothetical protein